MTNDELQQLKAAALKATPGPWDFDTAETPFRIAGGEVVGGDALPYGDVYTTREYETPEGPECLIIASEIGVDNGRYLRAANPAAILALIAKVESLAADAGRYIAWRDGHLADDESFMDAVYQNLNKTVPDWREPIAHEWDAAIDMAKEKA